MGNLEDKIALVAGATRGAGRGIARALGEAGATVYCSGRSVRGRPATGKRPETIDETAEMVTADGGRGIAVRTDHTVEADVIRLVERIRADEGRLDVLVNDIWGGDAITEWSTPFWELDLDKGFQMVRTAVDSHIITSRHAVPLMLEKGSGLSPSGDPGGEKLIVEITDGDSYNYRGNLFYDLVKTSVIRLAFAMAWELRNKGVIALAVTPGFLRSEAMLEHFGVTEENWRDGAKKDADFIASETPLLVGRAVAALAADPNVNEKRGRVWSSWNLAEEYGFDDADGSRPHWGRHFAEKYGREIPACDDAFYEYWFGGLLETLFPDWP